VEEVNDLLLSKLVAREKKLFVFFYKYSDIFAQQILRKLEEMDDQVFYNFNFSLKGSFSKVIFSAG